MRLVVAIFLISMTSLFADEAKYNRSFHSPQYLIQILKTKYEGKTLKELLSNAGANLDDEDIVVGPNGAGITVRSTLSNLETVKEIIKSCIPLQSRFQDSKQIRRTILGSSWDLSDLGIGTLKFHPNNIAFANVKSKVHMTKYRWVLTKQNLIEFRSDKGKLLFTSTIYGNTMRIHDFHSKPSIEITIRQIKEAIKPNKENKQE